MQKLLNEVQMSKPAEKNHYTSGKRFRNSISVTTDFKTQKL